jgi:hypothetical protein
LTIDEYSGLINLYTANSNTVGTHTATVTAKLVGYPTVASTVTFMITIEACIVTAFTMIALSPTFDKSYTINNPAIAWSIGSSSITTQVPACGYTQTLSSSGAPNFVTITPGSTINFSAYSTSFLDDGSQTITVTSTLNNYNFNPALPAPTCQSTFVLTVVASCDLSPTVWILPTVLDMTTSVLVQ